MRSQLTIAVAAFSILSSCGAYSPGYTSCKAPGPQNATFDGPASLSQFLGQLANPSGPQRPDDFVQIRNTAMLYPLIIDGKDFGAFSNLFTQNVVANLSQGPVINGLPALEGALAASVAKVDSHHNLGTQYINIDNDGCTAESVTYFHASLLGKGPAYGQVYAHPASSLLFH